MGWHFTMSTASLVGWLTSPPSKLPPIETLDLGEARMFLAELHHSPRESLGLFSDDPEWIDELRGLSAEFSQEGGWGADDAAVYAALRRYRRHFSSYRLLALAVGRRGQEYDRASAFVTTAAYASRHQALFMIPDAWAFDDLDLVTPFPAVSTASQFSGEWPGIVFWTPSGVAAFVPLRDAEQLYGDLLQSLRSPSPHRVGEVLYTYTTGQKSVPTLLHLSDLHFGTKTTLENQAYVNAEIHQVTRRHRVKRAVITGDLFDNPLEGAARQFDSFRQGVQFATGKNPVVVPGNHDQKLFGNFKWSREQLSDLEWSNLVQDDDLGMLFLCFDSSKDADLARGAVRREQRVSVAAAHQTLRVTDPRVEDYLSVALLHHHPFSFHVTDHGPWRWLSKLGIREEGFLRMEDGEEFVSWCAHRGVPLILHGHKHVPHHVRGGAQVGESYVKVDAVGCGSTTGAGAGPMSMNVVSWGGDRWTTLFLTDAGDGRGFAVQHVSARTVSV